MFDKWKSTVAMLVVGVLVGWGAWSATRKPATSTLASSELANNAFANNALADNALANNALANNALMSGAPTMPPRPLNPNVALLIGKAAPSIKIADTKMWTNTPRALDIADFKGRVLLLEFFRIKCSHCNHAAPYMSALHKNLTPQGLSIVAVQSPIQSNPEENDWTEVQRVVKTLWGATYPVAFDKNSQVLQRFYGGNRNAMRWPTVLLIDRNGKVIYGHTGHDVVYEELLYRAIKTELAKK